MHRGNGRCKPLNPGSTRSSWLCDLQREFNRLQLIDSAFTNSSGRQFWRKRYVTLVSVDQSAAQQIGSDLQKGGRFMELTGGCLCKAVDYRIAEAPVTARACWCRMCQMIGGGSGTVNALFNTTALTVN